MGVLSEYTQSPPRRASHSYGSVCRAATSGEGVPQLPGEFIGDVDVTGTLTKSAGSFKIDHPLDPENKYLSHSFVESPDMMNIYNGNVVLDATGEASWSCRSGSRRSIRTSATN